MTLLSPDDPVEDWIRGTFGLTLANFPAVRGRQVREMLAVHPRSAWAGLVPAVVSVLSIPETHFLRHPECFEALAHRLQVIGMERPSGPVRLWSAGCASGEEAYNLAAIGRRVVGRRVEVFGTDFSPSAVAKAREGRYGTWSLRGHRASEMTWLHEAEQGGIRVDDEIRALVTFEVGQLGEPGPPLDIDVAFCRNVLIYFSDEGSGRVLDRIASALRVDGILILAPTDPTPTALAQWTPVELEAPLPVRAYRPPGRAQRPPPAHEPDVAEAIRQLLRRR